MENFTRNRAKEHFPAVLLTLLSIVQAIALELLWGHVVDTQALYEVSFAAIVLWAQVLATLIAMVLVWVVYASNVMRFRWVPAITDSVYPFVVGIVEFWLVEALSAASSGLWFVVMGLVVGVMTWIAQTTMRRARFDTDNAHFFDHMPAATIRDFIPQFGIFGLFVLVGLLVAYLSPSLELQSIAVLLTLCFLTWQFSSTAKFWKLAIAESPSN